MPLKIGHGRYIDEDILTSLSKEPLLPHLNLNGVGGMLNNLDDHNVVEAADETNKALDDVDDKATKHVHPGLREETRERERERGERVQESMIKVLCNTQKVTSWKPLYMYM